MAKRSKEEAAGSEQPEAVPTRIAVAGFKSIREEQSIELRPLTILAGANSSGKSSMVQPLLMMKQTLEATYDPGPLLLNGPNVRFSEGKQLLSRTRKGESVNEFHVGIESLAKLGITTYFRKLPDRTLELHRAVLLENGKLLDVTTTMDHATLERELPDKPVAMLKEFLPAFNATPYWELQRERCFLRPIARVKPPNRRIEDIPFSLQCLDRVGQWLHDLVHLPALRGNPRRTYPVTAVGTTFSGTFDNYVASIIAKWQGDDDRDKLNSATDDLRVLGLSWKVVARRISDAEVELQVGRLPRAVRGGARDLVSIADVGFGVSQALPVVVALHAAGPEHLVYLEQPEIHLHPRAQVAMASVLARAVQRGVRVLIETHSPLLLLAVQHLVATGTIAPDAVKLHWFTRSEEDGGTSVTSADLDDAGAFGDWPEDFGDVEMDIEKRYMDAAEARMSCK
ncbi:MAG TPA: AAA family ATPase [Thermoguttaceae bacterium]|nr:AAA family ATPase [Thermoguttaceae bacterium]